MTSAAADASAVRIRERLAELAAIGGETGGGVTRLAYTEIEREAHGQFAAWARGDGASLSVDAAGNSVAVFQEGTPYFLIGSHLDTVVHGGRYDGAAGVVAALEVGASVGALGHGVRVVAFAGEEGARFGRPTLGSSFAAGLLGETALGALHDAEGTTLLAAAAELGLNPAEVDAWIGRDVACFFELHIEQGRQLEAGAARIGLVDAIAGSVRVHLQLTGRADHSGATPMRMRADALAAASELVLAVEETGRRHRSTVATVGRLQIEPNNVTTIPGQVTLWVDVRDIDPDVQRRAARHIVDAAAEIAERRHLRTTTELLSDQPPIVLPAWPRAILYDECRARGLSYRVLSSGAGHDAAVVARRAPAAMVFIPCVDGVSHSPRELASPEDIALATQVMCSTLRRTDEILDGASS
jgi:allantoate deiminase/N-carbamoyl-L-amino-acid hydrolase